MTYQFGKSSLAKLRTTHPQCQEVLLEAIENSPIDFGVSSGLRTAEEQYQLYCDGKSQLDGHNNLSNHQSGGAVDVFAYVDGKASYDREHLSMVAGVILSTAERLEVEMGWGGHWESFTDMPHFELVR